MASPLAHRVTTRVTRASPEFAKGHYNAVNQEEGGNEGRVGVRRDEETPAEGQAAARSTASRGMSYRYLQVTCLSVSKPKRYLRLGKELWLSIKPWLVNMKALSNLLCR